jgi:hypothetical protein
MAATFVFSESNGATPTVTDGITNVNFGSNDSYDIVPTTYPIAAGANSYEKWIRGKFTTYTSVTNLRFWKSAGTYVTGEDVHAAVNASFATPVATTSSVATVTVQTTEGTALAPTAPGASPDYSGYITMQLQTTGSTPPGAVNTKTFTLKYVLNNIQDLLLSMATLIEYLAISVKLLINNIRTIPRQPAILQRVRRDYTLSILTG